MGIEPTLPAWKAGTLPLSYTRVEHVPPKRLNDQSRDDRSPANQVADLRETLSDSPRTLPIDRHRGVYREMGGAGFEPAKAVPPDLQSGPFSHLGIHP